LSDAPVPREPMSWQGPKVPSQAEMPLRGFGIDAATPRGVPANSECHIEPTMSVAAKPLVQFPGRTKKTLRIVRPRILSTDDRLVKKAMKHIPPPTTCRRSARSRKTRIRRDIQSLFFGHKRLFLPQTPLFALENITKSGMFSKNRTKAPGRYRGFGRKIPWGSTRNGALAQHDDHGQRRLEKTRSSSGIGARTA